VVRRGIPWDSACVLGDPKVLAGAKTVGLWDHVMVAGFALLLVLTC
jgi:hypothetical protein